MNKADIVAELSRRMDIDQNTATNLSLIHI